MINYQKFDQKKLRQIYCSSEFSHIVIDDFINEEIANVLYENFPSINDCSWWEYNNVFEKKYAMNNLTKLNSVFQNVFNELLSYQFTSFLSSVTGIENILSDPSLFGGGLHQIVRGGKLDIHSDFPVHRITGWKRQINLIYYCNKDWKKEYGGDLELWDDNMKNCLETIQPSFNRAVIFYTGGSHNNHGHPKPLTCPPDNSRKSLASYYYTFEKSLIDPINKSTLYKRRPKDPYSKEKELLRIKRAKGRI